MKKIKKPFLLKKKRYFDKRGFFQELYLKKNFNTSTNFTAVAYSKKNVIRGIHFQLKNKQTKIISVISGKVLDVAVNLKKNSKHFGKIYYFLLNPGDTIYIPNYFAHGYECLSNNSTILYHLDNYRNAANENGILYNDKTLKIKWKTKKPILSERDKNHLNFLEFKSKYKGL